MELETKNAVIESAEITNDDHGCLTAWIFLDYGGGGQGFGGYALYLPKTVVHHAVLGPAGHFIWRVMEVAGVEKWSQLKGKTIRVKANNGGVESIGHIVKEDWFTPREDFRKEKAMPRKTKRRNQLCCQCHRSKASVRRVILLRELGDKHGFYAYVCRQCLDKMPEG